MHIKNSNLVQLLEDLNRAIFQISCANATLDSDFSDRKDFAQISKHLDVATGLVESVVEYFFPDDDKDCPEEPEEVILDSDTSGPSLVCQVYHSNDDDEEVELEEYAGAEASV